MLWGTCITPPQVVLDFGFWCWLIRFFCRPTSRHPERASSLVLVCPWSTICCVAVRYDNPRYIALGCVALSFLPQLLLSTWSYSTLDGFLCSARTLPCLCPVVRRNVCNSIIWRHYFTVDGLPYSTARYVGPFPRDRLTCKPRKSQRVHGKLHFVTSLCHVKHLYVIFWLALRHVQYFPGTMLWLIALCYVRVCVFCMNLSSINSKLTKILFRCGVRKVKVYGIKLFCGAVRYDMLRYIRVDTWRCGRPRYYTLP